MFKKRYMISLTAYSIYTNTIIQKLSIEISLHPWFYNDGEIATKISELVDQYMHEHHCLNKGEHVHIHINGMWRI